MFEPIRKYLRELGEAPAPLTTVQRWLFALTAIFVAATRFRARSLTPWDWDEALFQLAMQDYDVALHRPHPPGFPLFIAIAKLVRPLADSDFHALQTIAMIGAIALFPAIVYAAREARLPFGTALGGAFLCAFFPNVWFFGGTAFSDVPSIALATAAIGLLLHGCRSRWAYVLGAVVLAIAVGFRTQNLVLGLVPGLLATGYRLKARDWRPVVAAALLGAAIVIAAYGGAAWATGSWNAYREAVEVHRAYIAKTDSFRSPERAPLNRLFAHFFVYIYSHHKASLAISALAALSVLGAILRRYAPTLILLLAFGPFCIGAWLLLDVNSVLRFSIGYIPLFAILAADGARIAGLLVHAIVRRVRPAWIQSLLVFGIAAVLFEWTNGGLRIIRNEPAPSFAATEWIRRNLDERKDVVYVGSGMTPFARYALREFNVRETSDERSIDISRAERERAYLLAEGAFDQAGTIVFVRKRDPLNRIARERYFEVSVVPLRHSAEFRDGWYGGESMGKETWRWMAGRSVTLLPPLAGPAELRIVLSSPSEFRAKLPNVTVTLNGVDLETFPVSEYPTTRAYRVAPRPGQVNELVIETDRVLNPLRDGISNDPRDLGLVLRSLWWAEAGAK